MASKVDLSSSGVRTGQDTLTAWVSHWASVRPQDAAYSYVDYARHRDGLCDTVSWADLDRRVRTLAVRLRAAGAGHQSRAAIVVPQGHAYVVAFLACLAAGVIAVPLPGPDVAGYEVRLDAVAGRCAAQFVLTTRELVPAVRQCGVLHAGTTITVDDLDPDQATRYLPVNLRGSDVAYLQFTSGSTDQPTGAMITYANLVANARQAVQAFAVGADGVAVNWLPLFHDMGLVATIAVPALVGMRSVFMSPLAFVQRPVRWLRLLSQCREGYGAGPNFAFDHCADIPPSDRAGLDLRGVRCLLNGGEAVRRGTIERFVEEFRPYGLSPRALRPGYGLAEATVLAATSDRAKITRFDADSLATPRARRAIPGTPRVRSLVASGRPAGQLLRIVDPVRRTELGEGRIGEIWLHGPNIAVGYWGDPERSARTFHAHLKAPLAGTPRRPWLRTGDLGLLHHGQLYVTGRIKDLIIVDGRNHYPQDIESTVEQAHAAIRRGHVAAFGIAEGDEERVVVVAEITRREAPEPEDREALERAVRAAVVAEHNVRLHELVCVRAGAIPRTSSGKIQRFRCRDRYLASDLPVAASEPHPR